MRHGIVLSARGILQKLLLRQSKECSKAMGCGTTTRKLIDNTCLLASLLAISFMRRADVVHKELQVIARAPSNDKVVNQNRYMMKRPRANIYHGG